jgi:hypothetical protein
MTILMHNHHIEENSSKLELLLNTSKVGRGVNFSVLLIRHSKQDIGQIRVQNCRVG